MNSDRKTFARRRLSLRRGFTLVELLVVIVIIGLLASAVVANYDKIFPAGRRARVEADLVSIRNAIDIFKMQNNGRIPQSLELLVEKDSNGESYLKDRDKVPTDPWGNEYFYFPSQSGGTSFELGSYGADGAQGGDGEAGDIDLKSLQDKTSKNK